jgi:hypothetical protein
LVDARPIKFTLHSRTFCDGREIHRNGNGDRDTHRKGDGDRDIHTLREGKVLGEPAMDGARDSGRLRRKGMFSLSAEITEPGRSDAARLAGRGYGKSAHK